MRRRKIVGIVSSYVQPATQEIFKAVTAKYSAPDLIAQRAKSRRTSTWRCGK